MSKRDYDLLVIGSGPGGEGASMMAAKAGWRVAVVDENLEVGGNCTHKGTIPSKAIRHAISSIMTVDRNPFLKGLGGRASTTPFPKLLEGARGVINDQVGVRTNFYVRNHVEILTGRASFIDAHTVAIKRDGFSVERVTADHFIIATGSRPYRPEDINFKHKRILDSDTVLEVTDTPHTITIYGAGVIGCEYASMFGNLGVKVNLINTQDRLLSFMDDEITDALTYHLREQGVVIRHNEVYESVEADNSSVVLNFKSGKRLRSEMLLWANGRTGNTQNMGLEDINITPNGRGQLDINNNYQTAQPHIYAVGDVVGYPGLASAAYDQGRFAASHMLNGETDSALVEDIPNGIYTIPEISSVGKTEQELTRDKIPYEVGHASFKNLARAQMTGKTQGMLKLIFHRETQQILGVHCFGDRASEIVHIGQAIMAQEGSANNVNYFVKTTFNYPTMAEAYRVAALAGLNRLC